MTGHSGDARASQPREGRASTESTSHDPAIRLLDVDVDEDEGLNVDGQTEDEWLDVMEFNLSEGNVYVDGYGWMGSEEAIAEDARQGSTPEEAAGRLKHMTFWHPDTPIEEIVERLAEESAPSDDHDPADPEDGAP